MPLFDRMEKYFEELGTTLPTESDIILKLNEIRNCIVHNNGEIWDDQDKRARLIDALRPFVGNTLSYSLLDVINEAR
ncbi:hypothetical protein GCM10008018_45780 [Paenibacillus marchantiophytorum]|uniref:RiboL-PSP-HEPN domain-containing protein n=1 Tax=Paenibacillus marchantiophytorum TaxID=1619310 RepID=A0ABQ1F0A6_9BACL|nr:hypothetical protein GCM10008018_45780 [Paenibacillus marchantiophytorum]